MHCPIAVRNLTHPDDVAIVSAAGDTVTFRELDAHVRKLVLRFQTMGVRAGDRVGILSANRPELVAILAAVHRLNASVLMLNLQLHPADWEEQLEKAGAVLLLGEQSLIQKLSGNFSKIAAIEDLEQYLLSEPQSVECDLPELITEEEAAVIFTSSSTGHKKGVRLTLGNFFSSASASNAITGLRPGDRWAVSLPLFHVGGLGVMYRTLLAGACSYFVPNFSVDALYAAIETGGVTHLSVVPTVLEGLIERDLQSGSNVLNKLKVVILAGAASSEKLLNAIIEHRLPVLSAWGMTETTAHCTCMLRSDPIERVTGVGIPFPHTQVLAVDDAGHPVPAGTVGELIVSGPTVCLGYLDLAYGEPVKHGWLETGDLGVFDAEGYLTIAGRKDDMFISGGENIHPGEIEAAALTHPNAKHCAVVAVPHPKWGQRPVIFVEPKDPEAFASGEFTEFLAAKIAKIKVPDQVIAVSELPRTAIGKIDYKALRRDYLKA